MKRKNILFLITKSEIGGAQKFVYEQIYSINKTEWNVFLGTNSTGWLTRKVESILDEQNIFLDKKIALLRLSSILYLVKLYKFARSKEIDIIICNSANAGLYGRIVAFILKVKVIYVSHGWSSIYRGGRVGFILNKIELILSFISSTILCVSSEDAQKAKKIIGIKQSKIKVLQNSILRVRDNIHGKSKMGNNLYPTSKKIRVLTVCRLSPPKRIELLIEAIYTLDNFELFIVGNGELRIKLQNYAKSLGCLNVHFLGEINDFDDFGSYDIFTLISDSEGLPMSAIEAMSNGMPLLLSNVGGCNELIHNNGFLVENKKEEIVEKLKLINENISYYAINSAKLFEENFNLKNQVYKYEKLYKETLNE